MRRLLLAVLMLCALPVPAAQAAPKLTALGDAKAARSVTLENGAGTLALVVRNDSDRTAKLTADLQLTKGQATAVVAPAVEVGAGSIEAVTVKFGNASAFAGFLALGAPDDPALAPAVIELKSAAAASPRFEQEKSTFTVTRILGPFSWIKQVTWGHADVPLRDAGKANGTVDTEAWLPADSGKLLRAHIDDVRGDADGLWHARLDAGDPPRAGEYAGKLLMDASDTDSSALTVTARVQDFILWPLLAIIAGAALGGYGRRRYEQRRRRNSLRALLADSVKQYDCAKKQDGLPTLADRIGSYGDPRRERCDGDDVLALAELYCTLGKPEDETQLAATEKQVKALVADIGAWLELNTALLALKAAVRELPSDDELLEGAPAGSDVTLPRRDGEELLPGPDAVDDAAVVARARRRADRLVAALTLFTTAWKEHRILTAALADRDPAADPEAREALVANDPRVIYAGADREYRRTKEENSALVARLAQAVRELHWYRRELAADVAAEHPRLMVAIESGMSYAIAPPPGQVDVLVRAAVAELAPERIELPDPDRVRTGIRRWDTGVFAFATFIVALVYLIPIYHDKSFGGVFDYLTAFLAGASGAVLVPWELLPVFRTETAKTEPAAAAA